MTDLTPRERHLMEHTLGLDRMHWSYRNYFAAGDGHADRPELDALVARGLMSFEPRERGESCDCYRLTQAGAAAIGAELPRNIIDS